MNEPKPQRPKEPMAWPGVVSLAILVAGLVTIVWLVTR